jgi:dihydrofolate reductase
MTTSRRRRVENYRRDATGCDNRAMPVPTVSLIAAVARNGGIGKNNALLAHLPDDLAHFKRTTLGSPIVMGRKTWDSIGRALPGRRNVVVTRNPGFAGVGAERAASFETALELLANEPKIYVIGGASIYAAALPHADELVLTEIDADLDADTFFPAWNRADFRQTAHRTQRSPQGWNYSYATYNRQQGS